MVLTLLLHCYLYFLVALFLSALVFIVYDKDWAVCTNLYLKLVVWIQDLLLELNGITCKEAGCYFVDKRSPNDAGKNGDDGEKSVDDSDEEEKTEEEEQGTTNGNGGIKKDIFEPATDVATSSGESAPNSPSPSNDSFELVQFPGDGDISDPETEAVFTVSNVDQVSSGNTSLSEHLRHLPLLDLGMNLCGQGMQAIAREDLSVNFTLARDYRRYELAPLQKSLRLRLKLRLKRRRRSSTVNTTAGGAALVSYGRVASETTAGSKGVTASGIGSNKHKRQPSVRPRLLLFATLLFRLGALFPVRLALLTTSFLFLAICCLVNLIWPIPPLAKTKIAVIYCRMYTMGCGFIIRFHGTENRPKRPGIICANHLSPNDIHVMFADIPLDRDYLYLVTGQKHKGIIWALENLIEKMCPALWLERADAESRRRFSVEVLEAAKNTGPVILFPEGYCTNNSQVLQFRKAVFQEEITVYPVAIRQESRFGDSYWSENTFFFYLLRVLLSWAMVYNVYYLAPQRRAPDESATDFAARVQRLIATRVGVRAVPHDAVLWYKEPERRKALAEWQRRCATELREKFVEQWVIENEGSKEGNGAGIAGQMPMATGVSFPNENYNGKSSEFFGKQLGQPNASEGTVN